MFGRQDNATIRYVHCSLHITTLSGYLCYCCSNPSENGAHLLLEHGHAEVNLSGDITTVDLDLHQVCLTLAKTDLADLGVCQNTDDRAVLLHRCKLVLDRLLTLLVLLCVPKCQKTHSLQLTGKLALVYFPYQCEKHQDLGWLGCQIKSSGYPHVCARQSTGSMPISRSNVCLSSQVVKSDSGIIAHAMLRN